MRMNPRLMSIGKTILIQIRMIVAIYQHTLSSILEIIVFKYRLHCVVPAANHTACVTNEASQIPQISSGNTMVNRKLEIGLTNKTHSTAIFLGMPDCPMLRRTLMSMIRMI